jgi:predicted DNA-binding transcriptional regulator AlpA
VTGKEVVDHKGLKALGIRFCRVHLDRLEDKAEFPLSFKLGEHRNSPRVWWLSEIFVWLEARAATRQPPIVPE